MPSERSHIKEHYCFTVFNKSRKIIIGGSSKDNVSEKLFDLIQAGLVEKI